MNYCTNCGTKYSTNIFPKICTSCSHIAYNNPIPVAVAIVPVDKDGMINYLLVKRNIEPNIGELAFPGGFIESGETPQKAASRELWEETSINIDENRFKIMEVKSNPSKTIILLFLITEPIEYNSIDWTFRNDETLSVEISLKESKLCFSSHQEVLFNCYEKK